MLWLSCTVPTSTGHGNSEAPGVGGAVSWLAEKRRQIRPAAITASPRPLSGGCHTEFFVVRLLDQVWTPATWFRVAVPVTS